MKKNNSKTLKLKVNKNDDVTDIHEDNNRNYFDETPANSDTL